MGEDQFIVIGTDLDGRVTRTSHHDTLDQVAKKVASIKARPGFTNVIRTYRVFPGATISQWTTERIDFVGI